jgi:hypothetical protein
MSQKFTGDYLQEWHRAKQWRESREKELARALELEAQAGAALAAHLLPPKWNGGEVFNIWVNGRCIGALGDVMVQVVARTSNRHEISLRDIAKGKVNG